MKLNSVDFSDKFEISDIFCQLKFCVSRNLTDEKEKYTLYICLRKQFLWKTDMGFIPSSRSYEVPMWLRHVQRGVLGVESKYIYAWL